MQNFKFSIGLLAVLWIYSYNKHSNQIFKEQTLVEIQPTKKYYNSIKGPIGSEKASTPI